MMLRKKLLTITPSGRAMNIREIIANLLTEAAEKTRHEVSKGIADAIIPQVSFALWVFIGAVAVAFLAGVFFKLYRK